MHWNSWIGPRACEVAVIDTGGPPHAARGPFYQPQCVSICSNNRFHRLGLATPRKQTETVRTALKLPPPASSLHMAMQIISATRFRACGHQPPRTISQSRFSSRPNLRGLHAAASRSDQRKPKDHCRPPAARVTTPTGVRASLPPLSAQSSWTTRRRTFGMCSHFGATCVP